VSDISLDQLISHRAPMSLLSRFVSADNDSAVCEVEIKKSSAFFDLSRGGVPTYIGIEYIAQTIATFAGALAMKSGEEVKIGFLLGTRKLSLNESYFKVDKTYRVNVKQLYLEDSGLAVFETTVSDADKVIVSGNINTFQPENVKQFLEDEQSD